MNSTVPLMRMIITRFVFIVFHMLLGTSDSAGCQFAERVGIASGTSFFTPADQQLPPIVVHSLKKRVSSTIPSHFNLVLAEKGWHQMVMQNDRTSVWVLQICLDSDLFYTTVNTTYTTPRRTTPFFHGMDALTDTWCMRQMHRTHKYRTASHPKSISAYPVHYQIECVARIGPEDERYLVRMQLDHRRWAHQCLKFRILQEHFVVEISQSQSFTFNADENLCKHEDTFESSLWISHVNEQKHHHLPRCPFAGGFQLTTILDLQQQKPLCDYQLYATLESDCVNGEGTEWSFDDAACNMFEFESVTRLACIASWSWYSFNFLILYKSSWDGEPLVYSVAYTELPKPLNLSAHKYDRPNIMWIAPGLKLPMWIAKNVIEKDLATWKSPTSNLANWRWKKWPTFPYSKIYEIGFRRSFGHCDDERVSCAEGCDQDARNRLFCYRTCALDGPKCGPVNWDSCRFGSNYEGSWDFISTNSADSYDPLHLSLNDKWFRIVRLNQEKKQVSQFQCIRKVSETISDWFILRAVNQNIGCRPRDLCLELYQSGDEERSFRQNTHSMLYRLSKSHRSDTDARLVCNFPTEPGNKPDDSRSAARMLVRHRESQDRNIAPKGVKCGIYQIHLSGKMAVNMKLLSSFMAYENGSKTQHNYQAVRPGSLVQSTSYRKMVAADGVWLSPLIANATLSRWPRSVTTQWTSSNHRIKPSVSTKPIYCAVELTDFNRSIGTSGEFGDQLHVDIYCGKQLLRGFIKGTHRCLSVYQLEVSAQSKAKHNMILTKHEVTEEYLCWIFRSIGKGQTTLWTVYVFPSPQCYYIQMMTGEVHVRSEMAIGRMDLKSGACIRCHQEAVYQPRRGNELVKAQKISLNPHQSSGNRGRQTLRSLSKTNSSMRKGATCSGHKMLLILLLIVIYILRSQMRFKPS